MDWHHQLLASLVWLGEVSLAAVTGMAILIVALGRTSQWGRQVVRIAGDIFKEPNRAKTLIRLALIVVMTMFGVRMEVLFSFWYNGFYSAMQKLDAAAFWNMLAVFSILAIVHVVRALASFYLRQSFLIRWRAALTNRLMNRWLSGQAYYRSQYVAGNIDNPDQRIQQDADSFVSSSLNLSMGLLEAVVSLLTFSIILWNLSSTLTMLGWSIPRAMVFMVYFYIVVMTVFALKIGRPLIALSFQNEKLNANFRYALIRLREFGECVAFYRGEAVEHSILLHRFDAVIQNAWAIVFRSLKFQGLNLVASQAAVVIPFIVQAPRLLSKQISLGDVMQTAQSFGQVQTALSFIRNSYDEFAAYRAVIHRLSGFLDVAESTERLSGPDTREATGYFGVEALTVQTPDNRVVVDKLNLTLSRTASLLVRGKSGVGKSTLLRAIAGIWPYAHGRIIRPSGTHTLFLPQKPYIPLGSLRTALFYPEPTAPGSRAAHVLRACHLSHLIGRLDEEDDWSRILSLGEQQRLAIGRALLMNPDVIFLDEASSALDEGLEQAMYELLRKSLPDAIFVSVGHRASLTKFHEQQLLLAGDGNCQLTEISPGFSRGSGKAL